MNRKEKLAAKEKASTRQLMNITDITDYSLVTSHGRLVYFMIKPTNISVLSDASVGARIYALMNVLKGIAEIEILCLNSRENFEDNKSFLRLRMDDEKNPIIRKLLQQDAFLQFLCLLFFHSCYGFFVRFSSAEFVNLFV